MTAPTFANLTGSGGSSATSFTTASITPTGNRLLLLTAHAYISSGSTAPATPTVTGNGLTWVLVQSQNVDTAGADRATMFVFRAMGASPSAGAVTIDFGATTMTRCQWAVDQSDANVDTTGTNGSGAIVQATGATGASATSLSVNYPVAMTAGNSGFSAFCHQTQEVKTPRASWTELADVITVSLASVETQYIAGTDTAGSASWATSSRNGGIILEIAAAAAGGTDATVTAVPATATASAPAPTVSAGSAVTSVPATATAAEPAPTVSAGSTLTAVPATAGASMPAPTVSGGGASDATVTAVPATATASAPAPTVTAGSTVSGVAATATAAMPAPTVSGGGGTDATLTAVPATATAAALPPVVTADATITAVPAAATAAALPPTVGSLDLGYTFRTPDIDKTMGPDSDHLWARVFFPRGVAVLRLTTGAFVQQEIHDPDTPGVEKVYRGGCDNHVTSAEAADLTAAGYGPYLTAAS